MLVTAIVPTRNEADGIAIVVDALRPHVDEILVVDGHSNDDTRKRAEEAGATVILDNNKGKGDAYWVGIENAKGDIVVFMDADGSHNANDVPALLKPILEDRADLVIASRHKGGSDEWEGDIDTWLRAVGSGFLSVAINKRWGSNLTDVLNGFRAARREAALTARLHVYDFDVEQHMIAQFLKHGYRVTEIASHEECRKWGSSKLPTFRKAHLFFWRLFVDMVTGK
ncbi:MAG: glycosyltransferase family 2 protein [Candidatus Hydrogenedentes bacterium]|nr:glycosyltransferase family 2 protein [Candidatus Hydrogenedentota bacterium]